MVRLVAAVAVVRLVAAVAVVLTGLSAGFFYTYADSVTRGLGPVSDSTYVETFQSINDVVRTPLFMVVFAGPLIALAVAAVVARGSLVGRVLLVAALVAYAGVVVVTMAGNVPLNESLAAVPTSDPSSLAAGRAAFEERWNALNLVRTVLAGSAFGCAVGALAALAAPPSRMGTGVR